MTIPHQTDATTAADTPTDLRARGSWFTNEVFSHNHRVRALSTHGYIATHCDDLIHESYLDPVDLVKPMCPKCIDTHQVQRSGGNYSADQGGN